jgi:hypothetical protein
VPPGSEVTVSGNWYAGHPVGPVDSRNLVIFRAATGVEVASPSIRPTQNAFVAFVPPIPAGDIGDWYEGPVQLCVEVDGQQACHPEPLVIEPRASPEQPTGETLLSAAHDSLDDTVAYFHEAGKTELAEVLEAEGQDGLSGLEQTILQARGGKPPVVVVEDDDGKPIEVAFDLDVIDAIESLMVANKLPDSNASTPGDLPNPRPATIVGLDCVLPAELELRALKLRHDQLLLEQVTLASQELNVAMSVIVASCLAAAAAGGPAGCTAAASSTALPVLGTAAAVYAGVSWNLFLEQLAIKSGLNTLQSVKVEESPLTIDVGKTESFHVKGVLVGIS